MAFYLSAYLSILTLLITVNQCAAQGAAVIAGCTIGAVALIGIIIAIVVIILWRRKRRLGMKSFAANSSVYENAGISTVTSSQNPNTGVRLIKKTIKQKPPIAKKPDLKKTTDDVYENGDIQNKENENTIIPLSQIQSYVEGLRRTEKGFQLEYEKLPSGFKWWYEESQKEENKAKNKFTGYYPYDHNRVVLSTLPGDPSSSYINASFINGYKQEKFYIAAQAPKSRTVGDFWRMIWEHKCGKVVILTNLTEDKKVKCEKYWDEDAPSTFGYLTVTVTKEIKRSHWTIRHILVKHEKTKLTRSVLQFHFTAWPDHSVPEVTSLLEFIWRVKKTTSPRSGPLLVHCSAGIGRTGAFITIDYLLDQSLSEASIDVYDFVSKLRDQRKDMIQTKAQYECVYNAMLEAHTMGDTTLSCQEFYDKGSDAGSRMGRCTPAQFMKNLKKQPKLKEKDLRSYKLWVTEKDDHDAVILPSYQHINGYIVSEEPSSANHKHFWKMVSDWDSRAVVLLPEAARHLSTVSPSSGKSFTYDSMAVSCSRHDMINTTTVCRQLRITHESSTSSMNVRLYSTTKLKIDDIPRLLSDIDVSSTPSEQPSITTFVYGPNEKALAAMVSVLGCVLEGISLDEQVELYNKVSRVTRVLQTDLAQSDVQALRQVAYYKLPPASSYANFSSV